VRASIAARSNSRSTVAAAPLPPRVARALAARALLCGSALTLASVHRPRAARAPCAAPASALFKQEKDSIQWTTVLTTFVACVAVFVPLVSVPPRACLSLARAPRAVRARVSGRSVRLRGRDSRGPRRHC
jgi:hypothetical protein